MTISNLYPLTFTPVFKDYPWGGRNLETKLGRKIPDGIVAESWDIAAHPNGSSTVNNGSMKGKTLPEVLAAWGEDLVGERSAEALAMERFPLLIKILDANRWLSVQVHPDDAYGMKHENEWGKTEMWVVLHADPGAEIIYGFKPGSSAERYAKEIAEDRSADSLHRLPVKAGDVIFVPAGSIHALGPGIMVAEIQQNSDTTYRIYDWGRPRPLHIEKSLQVLNFKQIEPQARKPKLLVQDGTLKVELLAECKYFQTERVTLGEGDEFYGECDGDSFEIWAVLKGKATIESTREPVTLKGVEWALLPAMLGEFQVIADEASTLLRVFVP